jgi:hypothetical protein
MQVDGKKDRGSAGVAAGLKEHEADTIAANIRLLYEIIKDVEADTPFSAIRQTYSAPLDILVQLAGRSRDVNMLARLHAVISILETEDNTAEQKGLLIRQISQVEKMLQQKVSKTKPAVKDIIAGQELPVQIVSSPSQASDCENILRSVVAIGDPEIMILKEQGLLDADRLLNTEAVELARVAGISTNAAFEIKGLLQRDTEQRASQDVTRRVAEMKMINEQLSAECDRIIAANNTLLMNNKNVKSEYPVVSEQYDLEIRNFRALQSRVVSARIESNRISTEINFLRDEHQKLLDLVEEKHVLLDDLYRRFTGIRSSIEFVSGEAGFTEDMMMFVEGLLDKALIQKKSLNEKITSSEESMEKLFSEFNEIVKKGKTAFYRNI